MGLKLHEALWEFFVHILVATIIFVLIAMPAIGLNLLVHRLATYQIGEPILIGLTIVEYLIFLTDCLLFVVFLAKSIYRVSAKL